MTVPTTFYTDAEFNKILKRVLFEFVGLGCAMFSTIVAN